MSDALEQPVEQTPQPAGFDRLRLISERDAAKLLGVARQTLWAYRKRREISFVLIGDRPMYKPEHLEIFLARVEHRAKKK